MRRLSLCLAATAALAVPAAAGAAERFYGGSINNGGKIGIDVETIDGKPFEILGMAYRNLHGSCEGTPSLLDASRTFTNLFVQDKRFRFEDDQGPDQLLFTGTFRRAGRKIEGRIKEGPTDFDPGPVTCTSPKRGYTAKRGADGPHPKMQARVAKAVRVAP